MVGICLQKRWLDKFSLSVWISNLTDDGLRSSGGGSVLQILATVSVNCWCVARERPLGDDDEVHVAVSRALLASRSHSISASAQLKGSGADGIVSDGAIARLLSDANLDGYIDTQSK